MLKLYHSPRTRSVRVRWLLEELGVPHEIERLSFTPDRLKSPEYLKVHPLGKVPAICEDGRTMFESGAIVEYLLEKYGNGRLAPQPGSADRAPFLQWLHYAEATLLPPLGQMAQHMFFRPENERIPAMVQEGRERTLAALAVLDQAVAGRQYLLGAEFSAADIMTGYGLLLAKWFGLLGDFPNLTAYLDRLESRPALQKALAD